MFIEFGYTKLSESDQRKLMCGGDSISATFTCLLPSSNIIKVVGSFLLTWKKTFFISSFSSFFLINVQAYFLLATKVFERAYSLFFYK